MNKPKVLILIVDDDMSLGELYADYFRRRGYDADIASNGQEGYEKMAAEHPAIVLMDIVMSGATGDEILERAKSDPAVKDIPVIMLTNLSDSIELKNAMKIGAVGYIIKAEYTPAQVVDKVAKTLAGLPKQK